MPSLSIEDSDFKFKNIPVKLIAQRGSPEIRLAGETIGPLTEGKEFEAKFWIASELVKTGIARFREEQLDLISLHKLYWRETVQTGKQISPLPENFYPKLRRYLSELKESADPAKLQDYEKAQRIAHDIMNCRLKKIVGLASGPAQTDEILGNLSEEERNLYNRLHELVVEWRTKILKLETQSK